MLSLYQIGFPQLFSNKNSTATSQKTGCFHFGPNMFKIIKVEVTKALLVTSANENSSQTASGLWNREAGLGFHTYSDFIRKREAMIILNEFQTHWTFKINNDGKQESTHHVKVD